MAVFCLGLLVIFHLTTNTVEAIYDPQSVSNNRMGVHVLEPSEVDEAAKLVNSQGGEWGYVTVPIRADDRDREKWQQFFLKAREKKVIPILRIATFVHGPKWQIPTDGEILYFANFLNEMPWPTKNRYVIVFNEPNHSNEWGGVVDPEEYAHKLKYAIQALKGRSEDFFVLPAAMDRAAPDNHTSISADTYWKRVFTAEPDLVQMIDGWNAHAYPNPGFGGKPTDTHKKSVVSFRYELNYLKSLGRETIPVFITETGWSTKMVSPEKAADYWGTVMESVWEDPQLVAINVWLLRADAGPFAEFSLVNKDSTKSPMYTELEAMKKIKGEPPIEESTVNTEVAFAKATPFLNSEVFTGPMNLISDLWESARSLFRKIKQEPYVTIGDARITVEIADDEQERQLGLGYRNFLAEDRGMLFMYDYPRPYGFWMKETLIPLDMIWIRDGKVVDMAENVQVEEDPSSPTKTYSPKEAAVWILEANGGWANKHGVEIGDAVELVRE